MQIYQILNKKTGKSYVGKSKDYVSRFKDHKKDAEKKVNRRLYDSMNHHGVDNFELILLEDLGDVSRQVASEREIYWIEALKTMMPSGYNMTKGGDGGYTLDMWDSDAREELWSRQAIKRTGMKRDGSARSNMSAAAKLREATKTLDQKKAISKKISDYNKNNNIRPPESTLWKKGQAGTFTGKTHSDETKKLLSDHRRGKTYSDIYGEDAASEMIIARREAWLGSKNPNYIEFTNDMKSNIADYISHHYRVKMADLVDEFKLSEGKIREWFRELGIKNYQKLGYSLNIDEWISFWRKYANKN